MKRGITEFEVFVYKKSSVNIWINTHKTPTKPCESQSSEEKEQTDTKQTAVPPLDS